MSSSAAQADGAGGAVAAGGKKVKGKLFLIIGLIALLAGGGGAYWQFFMKAPASKDQHDAPKKPMTYVPMDTFTVNLLDPDQERYLQVMISLGIRDAGTADAIRAAMPALRNSIVMLLSNKTAETLMTREGKAALADEIQSELGKTMDASGHPGKAPEQVLFSSFVIQ